MHLAYWASWYLFYTCLYVMQLRELKLHSIALFSSQKAVYRLVALTCSYLIIQLLCCAEAYPDELNLLNVVTWPHSPGLHLQHATPAVASSWLFLWIVDQQFKSVTIYIIIKDSSAWWMFILIKLFTFSP